MGKVKNFIDGSMIFYLSEEPIEEYDNLTLGLYDAAVEEVRQCLKDILLRDVRENGYARAMATLHMPLGDVTVSVDCQGVLESKAQEVFTMPIGSMDCFTYAEVIREGTPIKMMLDFIYATCMGIDVTLERPVREEGTVLITEELLRLCHWCDPLGLHRMVPLVYEIGDCLKGMYCQAAGVVQGEVVA